MSDPAISRTKAAMEAAAKANGTAETAKRRKQAKALKVPAVSLTSLGLGAVFKDRYLVDNQTGGRPILLRGWPQAAAVLGVGVAVLGLASAALFGWTGAGSAGPADFQKRNAEIQIALDLMSSQIENQQAELFDLAAMERGLILVDSRDTDIETLMAENERLLSTLNTALALVSEPVLPGTAADAAPVETANALSERSLEDVHVLSRELELNKTRTDLLNAELEIERETIDKLAEELALSRQETRALERETLRLNTAIEGRDETIALLKNDVIALQTGQTDTDAARRRVVQLLNEKNAELTAEISDARGQLENRALQLKSLEARLAQSEADTTRLNSLLVRREEQISSLTEAQNLILDQLEIKVKEQTASLDAAIEATGVTHDMRVDLDALLDSITDPLWNGMGGAVEESEIEVEEFAVTSDGTTQDINALFDRALMVERMADELDQKQEHFDTLPTHKPVNGLRLSSGYGMRKHPISGKYRMHKGLDFAGPSGSRVSAAGPGKVIYAARKGTYGNLVDIDHGNGVVSRYAHLRKISVKKGAIVIAGQKIGEVGSTGASTGPHLHWEVRIFDTAKDPEAFLNARLNFE
jgi:murein DD-endopeptidase MepM/ murein hydrolase activator NlpD